MTMALSDRVSRVNRLLVEAGARGLPLISGSEMVLMADVDKRDSTRHSEPIKPAAESVTVVREV